MPRKTKIKTHGQKGKTRGRHKHRFSLETRVWNRMHRPKKYETYPCQYGHENCSDQEQGGPCKIHPTEEAA